MAGRAAGFIGGKVLRRVYGRERRGGVEVSEREGVRMVGESRLAPYRAPPAWRRGPRQRARVLWVGVRVRFGLVLGTW